MHLIDSAARAPKEGCILLILLFISQTEAFTWTQEPDKPTKIVEDGVNNKNVRLTWAYVVDVSETVVWLEFWREEVDGRNNVLIAQRLPNTAFEPKNNLSGYCRAELPSQLLIFNVDNVKEYRFSLVVAFTIKGISFDKAESSVVVEVYVPPRITVPPARTSRVDPGQNLTLMCNASGDPRPNITWTREGATQANQLVNSTGYRLYLVNVQKEDVGSYKCTANNGYGTVSSLALVNVRCPSNQCDLFTVGITILGMEFKDAFRNKSSFEYQQLASNVTSAITGPYSRPENAAKQLYEVAIEEFRNGSVMAVTQLQFQKGVNDPLQPLRDDMNNGTLGMFTVDRNLVLNPTTASPPSTKPTEETTVTASTKKSPDTAPPMITVWPKRRYKVDAGENLTLTCNSTGNPMPKISWTKEGVPQNQFYVSGHKLHLRNVKRKDVGSYRCTATNTLGTATILTIVNLNCFSDQCQSQTVTISIPSVEWKESLKIRMSAEFETLESNLLSAIASVYTKFPQKELYELAIEEFRNGSTGVVAIVQLLFGDPLQPLQNGITDGKLGPLAVVSQLDINLSTTMIPATPSGDPARGTPKTQTNSSPSDTGITVIMGGCIALILATVMCTF